MLFGDESSRRYELFYDAYRKGLISCKLFFVLGVSFPFNKKKKFGLSSPKELMKENDFLRGATPLMEVIHVELADERVHIGVFEVGWKNSQLKLVAGFHLETGSVV